MSDTDPLANIQPAAPVEPVAPVAPTEPLAPKDPVAPVVPDAPVNGTGDEGKLTDEEKAEADEWDAATDELFPGLKKSEEDNKDGTTKPEKTTEEKAADEAAAKDKKSDEAKGAGDAADKGGEAKKPDSGDGAEAEEEDGGAEPDGATARLTAREEAAQIAAVKTDVQEKMNIPTEWKDADGDPIKSVADVMKLINPETVGTEEFPKGRPFTAEEAARTLDDVERQLAINVRQIDQIAETNLDLKDQADVVNYQYGELLKALPEVRAKLWAEYEKTLTKDAKSGIITKAPTSLQNFYEIALEPYAQLGRQLETQETAKTEETAKAEADRIAADKAAADAKKTQTRQDRSDIYGSGKVDTQTEDDKEWSAAAEAVFGPLTK